MVDTAIDIALSAALTGGIRAPTTQQEGYQAVADGANNLNYIPNTNVQVTFATHAARDADATAYESGQIGITSRVSSDGTLWTLSAIAPNRWDMLRSARIAHVEAIVTNTGGTLVQGVTIEEGYRYDLRFHAWAEDGSAAIEFFRIMRAFASRPAAGAAVLVQAAEEIDGNAAASWVFAVAAATPDIEGTITNDTGTDRTGQLSIEVLNVQKLPATAS